MIRPVSRFLVSTAIPQSLQPLVALSRNFWWCWNSEAVALWSSMDPLLWNQTHHNPVLLLQQISHARLQELANDEEFQTRMRLVCDSFREYIQQPCGESIAYFCAEFGLHESFQMYSGGLGVLAGDHLKSASDLRLPLIGIGLLYQEGYFRQYLTENGWQNEHYHEMDFHALPIEQVHGQDGQPLRVHVDMPLGRCYAAVWRVAVGRITLYLLDSNVEENHNPTLRDVTDRLYGGTTDTRIMQEMLLGIGGMRALDALGITPSVTHINEGHAAFSMLERSRQLMASHHLTFAEAFKAMQSSSVFTTHTPVPAGNEVFDAATLDPYFRSYAESMGLTWDTFLQLGQAAGSSPEKFSMTILGIRGSSYRNGVSSLHGQVAREMWHGIWPAFPANDAPITGLVNGIHTKSWVAPEIASIYDRYIGNNWREKPWLESTWELIKAIPDHELWQVHEKRRSRLIDGVRTHILEKHHASLSQKQALTIHECLDPTALTIGFARRFATYKRADLLVRDMDRLTRIVHHSERPVQFILAGKAHPRDVQGKELIQRVHQMIREHDLEKHIVFLEDYEMDVARLLVRGCDVWLNTPRRPHEASGTSGMKAALNGVLHCSILDGWWAEAYNGKNGWAIGRGEMMDDEEQDNADSATLYDILEYDVVPRFYKRDDDGVPRAWTSMMKENIRTNAWRYAAERMVGDYHSTAYAPADARGRLFTADHAQLAREIVAYEHKLHNSWNKVCVTAVTSSADSGSHVGDPIHVEATVFHGPFSHDELLVQLISGPVNAKDEIEPESSVPMTLIGSSEHSGIYRGTVACNSSGFHGCTVRVLPSHSGFVSPIEPGLSHYPHQE
ncbi:MAG: glycosyltransferase family 1 protein [Ignavibacteria bacterium]|nr:glycosyltransferase family 1 protein [Ignavibacteria bacterium]